MSERQHRKAMVRERIRNDRDLIGLEVEGMRARVSSATRLVKVGRDLLRPVGAVAAATAVAAVRSGKAVKSGGKAVKAGARAAKSNPRGAATLAALIPVALAVGKLVAVLAERRTAKAGEHDAAPGAARAEGEAAQ